MADLNIATKASGDLLYHTEVNDIVAAINGRVEKVTGKALSTNDYTNTDKAKLDGLVNLPTGVVNLTQAANVVVNATGGKVFRLTMTASCTIANPTGGTDGQEIEIEIKQGGTGGFVASFASAFSFNLTYIRPESDMFSTAVGKRDKFRFQYNQAEGVWDCVGQIYGCVTA